MPRSGRLLVLGAAVALLAGAVAGHVRLVNPSNGKPLSWPSPIVPIVVQVDGSDDVPDHSDDAAIRMAMQDWTAIGGSAAALVEDTDPRQRARTDWASRDVHLVWFDEDDSSGYFEGSGILAITPVVFFSGGQIGDADVLFNGRAFHFTTSGEPGAYDIQGIATHELGHVIGLDHSGWPGATMYPYVDSSVVVNRSPSEDEVHGARSIYPAGKFATLTGTVTRAVDANPVAGAHVTARDASGRPSASTLTGAKGKFTLRGLDAGEYTLVVNPLDGPVHAYDLEGGRTIETDFGPLVSDAPVTVPDGGTASAGTLSVPDEATLHLGRSYDVYPIRVTPGLRRGAVLRGSALVDGCVLTASDPAVTIDDVTWGGTTVSFLIDAPAGTAFGNVDLEARAPDGETSVLIGAMELAPADPRVDAVEPAEAGIVGGTPLTIRGAGFRAGERVVIGDRIYRDGVPGGLTVVDGSTLTLTLGATDAGLHDVVVLDPSGVEGRLVDGLEARDQPVIATVFPPAGQGQGGTRVRVTGAAFQDGLRVTIDGEEQADVQVIDDGRLEFTTTASRSSGAYQLALIASDGYAATTTFTYTDTSDPVLLSVQPGEGDREGGEAIDLAGLNLDPSCRALFGVDPDTGLGGAEGTVVDGAGGTSLVVVTPALATTGRVCVAIEDPSTGQASLLEGGFLVRGDHASGGACASVGAPPRTLRDVLAASGWLAALGTVLAARAALARRRIAGSAAA